MNDPTASNSESEDAEFHRQIQQALDKRDTILLPIEALCQELPVGAQQKDLSQFVRLLRNEVDVDRWLEHPRAATWLPIVMESARATDTVGSIEQLMRESSQHLQQSSVRILAIFYPMFVFSLAMVVAVAMSWLLVPIFAEMFIEFDIELPAPTLLVIGFSNLILLYPVRCLIGLVGFGICIVLTLHLWKRYAATSRPWGYFLAGNTASVYAMGSAINAVAKLLNVGAPLPRALQMAARGCRYPAFKPLLYEVAEAVKEGHSLKTGRARLFFPANFFFALQPSQGGPPNIALMQELSQMYHRRVNRRVNWFHYMTGPMVIVAVGSVVGVVVVALFMPVVSLVSVLS